MSAIVRAVIGVVEIVVGVVFYQPWLIAMGVSTPLRAVDRLVDPPKNPARR